MRHPNRHDAHPVSDDPGWSLLRLSAGQRLGLVFVVVAALWAATFAVIA